MKSHILAVDDHEHIESFRYAFPNQRKGALENGAHVRNAIARFNQVKDVSETKLPARRGLRFASLQIECLQIFLRKLPWTNTLAHGNATGDTLSRTRKQLVFLVTSFTLLSVFFHVSAQTPASIPAFEVSTVKPSSPNNLNSNLNFKDREIISENLPVMFLIQYAYNLSAGSENQIIGAPAWLRTSKFDIVAKKDDETVSKLSRMSIDESTATQRLMLQSLLADRFHLKIHHETRALPVIALTLAKPKSTFDRKLIPAPDPSAVHDWRGLHNDGQGHIEGRGVPLSALVSMLASQPEIDGRLVVDQTGATGNYNFTLNWTPQRLEGAPDNGSSLPAGPSLFAALTEQLGLKLTSTKAPVDVIVIDHIDPPTPN